MTASRQSRSRLGSLTDSLLTRLFPRDSEPAPPRPTPVVRSAPRDALQRARKSILNIVASNPNPDSAIVRLRDEVRNAIRADKCIIYRRRENSLINPFAGGSADNPQFEYNTLPITAEADLAGFVAVRRKPLLLRDVYDAEELARVDPQLRFDDQWDRKHGVRTRAAAVVPISGPGGNLLGVIQAQNLDGGAAFTHEDVEHLKSLAETLGQALYLKVGQLPDYLAHIAPAYVTEEQLRALLIANNEPLHLLELLMEEYHVPLTAISKALESRSGCEFIAYEEGARPPSVSNINPAYLRKNLWVPVEERENGSLVVAIDNPQDAKRTSETALLLHGREVEFRVALRSHILKFIDALEGVGKPQHLLQTDLAGTLERLEIVTEEEEEQHGNDISLTNLESNSPAIQLVDSIILEGVHRSASDIHIEPVEVEEKGQRKRVLRVRYRIDGECTRATTLPIQVARAVLARLKIMSRLDVSERRIPQSGKIKIKGMNIELRLETCPTSLAEEKAVLRILASRLMPLEKLITNADQFRRFRHIIDRPHGIVLVVGPTGSGKTTTLHAALHARNEPGVNIITAEDPVEITQPGITQVQVNYDIDLTFPAILRSFLRQDPDIIMVGEIRDAETARIALEAAQTGHLVFSTLHTNSAPETVTRLFDLGLDPYYFASAISGILAQRLVRRLCEQCKHPRTVSAEELEELGRSFGDEALSSVLAGHKELTIYEPVGCEVCGESGYKGRLGIHEILDKSPELVELMQRKAATPELTAQAIKDGMRTLFQDGMRNVIEGHTSWEEIVRVCSSDD